MKRVKKGEFEDLDTEWKDGIVGKTTDEINAAIAEIAKLDAEMFAAKKADEDLKQAKLAASEAGELYREAEKMSKLRIRYCVRVLSDRGKQ